MKRLILPLLLIFLGVQLSGCLREVGTVAGCLALDATSKPCN